MGMMKGSRTLFKEAAASVSTALSDLLVCPLSKQPLRLCPESNTLISDTLGASYPIVDGIPCLVPTDGKVLDSDDETAKSRTAAEPAGVSNESSRDAAQ